MLVPLLQSQVPPPLSIRRVIWIWRWDKDSLAVRGAGGNDPSSRDEGCLALVWLGGHPAGPSN